MIKIPASCQDQDRAAIAITDGWTTEPRQTSLHDAVNRLSWQEKRDGCTRENALKRQHNNVNHAASQEVHHFMMTAPETGLALDP